jgi:GntR family transcriptional repressor for pyruvate dehydrogenase complex
MIERKKLADFVVEDFKKKVTDGIFKEGDKLPNQGEYAKQIGVSRLSLREGMQKLQAMGAITQRPKVGTVVVCGDPNKWIAPMKAPLLDDAKAVNELVEVRIIIESALTKMCTALISDGKLDELIKLTDDMEKSYIAKDWDTFSESDISYHQLIANEAGNRYLKRMFMEILNLTVQFVYETFKWIPETTRDACIMHRKITEAIQERDSERAAAMMEEHLSKALEHYNLYSLCLNDQKEKQ